MKMEYSKIESNTIKTLLCAAKAGEAIDCSKKGGKRTKKKRKTKNNKKKPNY